MIRRPHAPLTNSYWVLPGRLLAGEHPAGRSEEETRARLAKLTQAGIDTFFDLTSPTERAAYDLELPFRAEYRRHPIKDHDIPDSAAQMASILEAIDAALAAGRRAYVHCRAGIGRTGMVIGCLLIERGRSPEDALMELNMLWQECGRARDWPSVPETEEQVSFVRAWRAGGGREALAPRTEPVARSASDRFLGSLFGLAVCDALSVGTQGHAAGTFAPVTGYTGGGANALPPGAWSDDTAMALCLAESLIECRGFDARDQVERYARWRDQGEPSATGQAVGLRPGTARALARAQWRRQAFSGSHDPEQLDPEPLSRVAPAVLYFFESPEEAARHATDAARTTHQAPIVLDACRLLAVSVHAAASGAAKADVLAAGRGLDIRDPIRALAIHGAGTPPDAGAGDTAPAALHRALWAFGQGRDFADGALRVVNLGGASDVAGAAYGQLAGAHYGLAGIPAEWRNGLIGKELIERLARGLAGRSGAVRQG